MDIADNLDLSFKEQAFLQLERLRDEVMKKDKKGNNPYKRRWLKYRLYRYNIYEHVNPERQERLERLLIRTLTSIGEHINRNLFRARLASSTIGPTPTPVRDLSTCSPTPSRSTSSRSPSVVSEIFDPIAEVVVISSDEEVDSEDEVFIKEEPSTPTHDQGVCLGDIQRLRPSRSASGPESARSFNSSSISNYFISNSFSRPQPFLLVDRRNPNNYVFDSDGVIHLKGKNSVKFTSASLPRQAFILHIVAKVIHLMESKSYMMRRELYYKSQDFCRVKKTIRNSQSGASQLPSSLAPDLQTQNQSTPITHSQIVETIGHNPAKLDIALDDICCLVGCSKIHMRIVSQPKGIVFGHLNFRVGNGSLTNCMEKKEGILLPTAQEPITFVESDAKFILILEKDSVLQKILNQKEGLEFVKKYKVILITGRGYPDINTRAFLNFLWYKLKIPVLALTDADPHGLEIVCSYKFGCYTTAYESPGLSVPQIKWLGLLPGDINRLSLPDSKTISLSFTDLRKISSLMGRPYLKERPTWLKQLQIMRDSNKKAELESLDSTGEYLVRTYLPNKLRYASWL